MIPLISILLFFLFTLLSLIHFYWLFGGRWGTQAVYPTKDDRIQPNMPGIIPTLIVAIGLLTIGLFILKKGIYANILIPAWIDKFGLWIIAGIFIIRAIGEFNYIGIFKKVKNTKFGKNDSKYYSPLSLIIGILTILIALNT